MSSAGATTAQFAIRYADIIFAEVLDPNGQNPKTRRVVVLSQTPNWRRDFPLCRWSDRYITESSLIGGWP
jgi:hypothetical protein